ncbi:EF-hand domain-containing protein [Chitinimonas sp.]|uniref:EF-hand domain-containing protein n=1 Tax=Chitinimonas sp. TaxID=1934313 RepID=UPI0035B05827
MNKLLVLLAILSCGTALAEAPGEAMAARLQARFNAADTNHDGKLSEEEARTGMPRVAKHFTEIDQEKRGYVTLEQLQAFAKQRRAG